jgi:predicted phosphoribosyltransferase
MPAVGSPGLWRPARMSRRSRLRTARRCPRCSGGGRVDDGIATGATTRAALRATRLRRPKHLILAVAVAPNGSPRSERPLNTKHADE